MLLQSWAEVFTRSFQDLGVSLIQFLPNILTAAAILVLGWLVAAGLGRVIAQIVDSLRVDTALHSSGVTGVVERSGFTLDSGAILGGLVRWFVIVVFLMAALEVVHLNQITVFLQNFVLAYLPRVIVAVLILLFAALIAEVVDSAVVGVSKAAKVPSAAFLGRLAKWSIWTFAILAALNELDIAGPFVQTLFTGIVIAASLGLGLAFGLGGQGVARRFLERMEKEIATRNDGKNDTKTEGNEVPGEISQSKNPAEIFDAALLEAKRDKEV